MQLKNLSLTLLASITICSGTLNNVWAAAPTTAQEKPVRQVNTREIARSALDQKLAAAQERYDALKTEVDEKENLANQASAAFEITRTIGRRQLTDKNQARADLDKARAALYASPEYVLVTQLNKEDEAALLNLYTQSAQIAASKARVADNIQKMSDNADKYRAELDKKKAELDELNGQILAAANAKYEYTRPQAEIKGEELAAKQAELIQAQAKQAELHTAVVALESKIRASDVKLTQLELRIPAAKAAKAVDKGASLQSILADQKTEKATKTADSNALSNNMKQSEATAVEIQQLQNAIESLNADIAALPPTVASATSGTDHTAGETIADKLKRLPVLKARIQKLKASQDSGGKLQKALADMKASLDMLDKQSSDKEEEIRTFIDRIVAQRTVAAGGGADQAVTRSGGTATPAQVIATTTPGKQTAVEHAVTTDPVAAAERHQVAAHPKAVVTDPVQHQATAERHAERHQVAEVTAAQPQIIAAG